MKTILISSTISLAIGFLFGWLTQSTSADLDRFVPQTGIKNPPRAPDPTPAPTPERAKPDRPASENSPRKEKPTGTAAVPEAAKQADRAKWMRLIEVLSLNEEQAKALEAVVAESRPKSENGKSPEIIYAEAGTLLEKNILALLNADQRQAFAEMQRRAKENRIEISAQQSYSQELGELDLSAEQRTQALGLLRGQAEQDSADIPSSTRLLLTGSFLPIGEVNFSEDAIRLLRQLSPQDSGDIALDKLAEKRRIEAGEKVSLFEKILSPAQLELYRSRIYQTPNILDQIRSSE